MDRSASHRPLAETLDRRQRWLLLFSLMVSLFMGALDQTIVSTAAPRIVSDLGGFALLSWVFTVYMLTSTVSVPLVGKLSDTYGRKPFLLAGIVLFLIGSALCGAAPTMVALIAFRGIQGVGGGVLFATIFATTGDLFSPAERGRYMGLFTGTFSLASIVGPSLGGFLTDHVGWRWIFYVNVPVGVVAFLAIGANLPATASLGRRAVDYLGAALLAAASVLLLLAFVWAGDRYPWASAEIVGLLSGAVVLLFLFSLQELRHPDPMVPLYLFRNREFLVTNLVVFFVGLAMFGAIAYLPTFVQTSLGASATASGIITTPQSLGVLAASVVGGNLMARLGRYKAIAVLGALLLLAGILLLRTVHADMPRWHVSAFVMVTGVGFGLVLPTMSVAVQNAVDYRYLGVATSSSQFFRQIGAVIGTAIFGSILATSYRGAFADVLPAEAQTAIPPPILAQFEDPTLALDARRYAVVLDQLRELPQGEQLLSLAVAAQREAVALAMEDMFTVGAVFAAFCVLFTLALRGLPLRRSWAPTAPEGAAAPSEPAPAAQALGDSAAPGPDAGTRAP